MGGGAGERKVSGACKHCFQYLIPVYHLLCTYDWSIFAVYVKHVNRDFKIQRGDGNENVKKGFDKQNNNFARTSYFFVHFFAVFAVLRRENV